MGLPACTLPWGDTQLLQLLCSGLSPKCNVGQHMCFSLGITISFPTFKFAIATMGKKPVCFLRWSHLRRFGTDDYLINAFFGELDISFCSQGPLPLEHATWNQCILQVHRSNAANIKNKQPPKFVHSLEVSLTATVKIRIWYFSSGDVRADLIINFTAPELWTAYFVLIPAVSAPPVSTVFFLVTGSVPVHRYRDRQNAAKNLQCSEERSREGIVIGLKLSSGVKLEIESFS